MTPALEPLRRIAAYAVCTDADGRVLLVRASTRSGTPGVWSLPVALGTLSACCGLVVLLAGSARPARELATA